MSIYRSQAILKCFTDLKSSVWFTLGSEDETMVCDMFCDTTINFENLNFLKEINRLV